MPRWKELKRFCEKNGWELYKDTDHYFYRKIDDDGSMRMTKVSKGSGEIHTRTWKEILKKQLKAIQCISNSCTIFLHTEIPSFHKGICFQGWGGCRN